MKIKTQYYNNIAVIELQGEFTGDFIKAFQDTVSNIVAEKINIVLDMSNVGFIDSQGLEQLLWLRNFCVEHDCQMKIAALDETCGLIFKLTRLYSSFDGYAELGEAIKSFV